MARLGIKGGSQAPGGTLPVEAIIFELCKTKDATEKMQLSVMEMRKDVHILVEVLTMLLKYVGENNENVLQAIDELQRSRIKLDDSMQKMDNLDEQAKKLVDSLDEVRPAVDGLKNEIKRRGNGGTPI